MASEAVQAAMSRADEVLGSVAAPAPPETDAFSHFTLLGHVVQQCGRVVFCSSCSAFFVVPDGACRGLKESCKGRSKHPSTRSSQATKVKYALQGRPPKTGELLT